MKIYGKIGIATELRMIRPINHRDRSSNSSSSVELALEQQVVASFLLCLSAGWLGSELA